MKEGTEGLKMWRDPQSNFQVGSNNHGRVGRTQFYCDPAPHYQAKRPAGFLKELYAKEHCSIRR